MASELVASGIERMEVQFGIKGTGGTTQYVNTINGSSSTLAATDWDGVKSVRIWLLARNATPEPGYTNANTYVMGDRAAYVPNDSYRRQLFTTVVELRNGR
jgi:type IV pilus assembly protein PilW